jgi:hypothetical protein
MADLEHVEEYVHSAKGDRYDLVGRRVSVLLFEKREKAIMPDGSRQYTVIPYTKCGVALAHRYREESSSVKPLYWVRFDDGTEENEIHSKFIGPEPPAPDDND